MTDNVATVLYNSDEDSARVVQLAAEFHPAWGCSIEVVTATLQPATVELVRMTNNKKPKHFSLTDDEADAFAVAWTAYRADLKAREEAEERRLQDVVVEAYAIAKKHPVITIEESPEHGYNGKMAWKVSVPKIGHEYYSYARHPESLIDQVNESLAAYHRHQRENAFFIARNEPKIKIHTLPEKNESGAKWEVSCPALGEPHRYIAYDGDRLLFYVQECQRLLQERTKVHEEKVAQ